MTGHFATWPVPEVMLSIRAMTDLLVDAQMKKANYKDFASVKSSMEQHAGVPAQEGRPDAGDEDPGPVGRVFDGVDA